MGYTVEHPPKTGRGAGKAFSAGGDIEMVRRVHANFTEVVHTMQDARDIVLNIVNCDKPIISAINGVTVGPDLPEGLAAVVAKRDPDFPSAAES